MPFLSLILAIFLKKPAHRSVVFCCLLLFIAGCIPYSGKDEHPEYFQAIFRQVDSIAFRQVESIAKIQRHKAFGLLDSAYKALPGAGIGDLYSIDSIKYQFIIRVEGDQMKALAYADTMLHIAAQRLEEEKYAERYVVALYLKGECFQRVKRYEESLQYYTLGKEAFLKYVKNKCRIVSYYGGSKAHLLFKRQKYMEAAHDFLKQHEDILLNCRINSSVDLIHLEASLNNAALSYLRAGLYDSATYYQDSALNTIRTYEYRFPEQDSIFEYAKGIIYSDQAEIFVIKGKIEEAESLYKRSIVSLGKIDMPYTQSTQARLIEIYFKKNRIDSAAKVLSEMKSLLVTPANDVQLVEWHKLKIKYFALQKNVDSLFSYQYKYDSLSNLVASKDREVAAVDLNRELNNLQLKYSNDLLKKESKLKNQYLIISIIIFVMGVVIVLQTWYSLRKTKKLNLQMLAKNEELQRAFISLEQSHAENARIMKIVAHDLKNPISAMKNVAYSLLKKETTGVQKNALGIIHDSCINSLSLINDLLYEKKNVSQLGKEIADIKKTLEQCVELLQAKANEKNQKLLLEAEPVFVFVNVEKIWRVITNIVNNAIKFSHTDTEINIRLEKKDNYVLLSVRDDGIGIPTAIADKIFSISGEVGRSGTSGEESHGLGMSISQIIVEEHEGKIWFESEEGKGAVFYVKLPVID
jgi:signal transduction histidine kinase